MPLYEYRCQSCRVEFEALVRGQETPTCPACRSADLGRVFSVSAAPQVAGGGGGTLPMAAPTPGMCGRSACMTGGCQGLGGS